MPQSTIFATPLAGTAVRNAQTHKRKRHKTQSAVEQSPDADHEDGLGNTKMDTVSVTSTPVEYTAVVTPAERSQRRLAGMALDQAIPNLPFPHSSLPNGRKGTTQLFRRHTQTNSPLPTPVNSPSLREQHLAAMVTVLHRSMMEHDYTRAKRALGLILRCEVGGQPVDIRSIGLWGIGAEILLRTQRQESRFGYSQGSSTAQVYREGFEQARSFYEALAVQYPPNKTWPDAINSIDFLVAMFGLWIHIVHQEALQISVEDDGEEANHVGGDGTVARMSHEEKLEWELAQARHIADAMDNRMKDVVYRDQPELTRLRGMVALWMADLFENLRELEDERGLDEYLESEIPGPSNNVERLAVQHEEARDSERLHKAAEDARRLAQSLLDRSQGFG